LLYTPHARVFLSAVPVFSGSNITGFFEVEDPRWAARAWELAERDQRRAEAPTPVQAQNGVQRIMKFVRAQRAAA
jgi:hypothetical protein